MTKIISLSQKAYETLKKLKRNGESFSDVIARLTREGERKPLLAFAGKWTGDDLDKVFRLIGETREKSVSREVKL
jgi:predicted CopG family antitoxin